MLPAQGPSISLEGTKTIFDILYGRKLKLKAQRNSFKQFPSIKCS